MEVLILSGSIFAGFVIFTVVIALFFRIVVPTNEVHIVQSAKKTMSYGKDTGNGNTYYRFPRGCRLSVLRRLSCRSLFLR